MSSLFFELINVSIDLVELVTVKFLDVFLLMLSLNFFFSYFFDYKFEHILQLFEKVYTCFVTFYYLTFLMMQMWQNLCFYRIKILILKMFLQSEIWLSDLVSIIKFLFDFWFGIFMKTLPSIDKSIIVMFFSMRILAVF